MPEEITPELFDDLLKRSLAFLQLETDGQRRSLTRVFAARLQYVYSRHPDASQRQHFYRLGLPLRDCERVDGAKVDLLALFQQAIDFHVWDVARRAEFLAELADILFELDEIKPSGECPKCWKHIVTLWLSGQTPTEIARDPEVAGCEMTTHAVSRWIDDVCGYRLPWGYNMLSIHMKRVAEEAECEIPAVCDSFSSLVKYGVHEPVACWLLTFGIPSRRAALRAAELVDDEIADPKALLEWLRDGGLLALRERGLDEKSLHEIEEAIGTFENTGERARRPHSTVYLPYDTGTATLDRGSRLLLQRGKSEPNMTFRVLTVGGKLVGSYKLTAPYETLWGLLEAPELVNAVVQSVTDAGGAAAVEVLVSSV